MKRISLALVLGLFPFLLWATPQEDYHRISHHLAKMETELNPPVQSICRHLIRQKDQICQDRPLHKLLSGLVEHLLMGKEDLEDVPEAELMNRVTHYDRADQFFRASLDLLEYFKFLNSAQNKAQAKDWEGASQDILAAENSFRKGKIYLNIIGNVIKAGG